MAQRTGWTDSHWWRGPFDFTLENGLRVLFAQREKSPLVELRLAVDGGFALDPEGKSGMAGLAAAMFSEGLLRINDAQAGSALEVLGALSRSQLTPDAAVFGLSALKANLREALRIYASAITHSEFTAEDYEILRANRLALIADERLNPWELALRVVPPMVYGLGHIYARPFTGSGIECDITAINGSDLRSYYATYLAPQRTTLLVAGSFDASDLRTQLEQAFGKWHAARAATFQIPARKTGENGPAVILINRPGASQTALAAGLPTVARKSDYAEALMVADTILGGTFTSRLNMSLRERKGWTYGVRSSLLDARLQGLWLIRSVVRTDRTAQAMAEIAVEVENLAGLRSVTPEEFARAIDYLVARIPSCYETCAQMADALAHLIVHHLPVSYPQTLASRLRSLTPQDVSETWRQMLSAGGLRWMVVGEAAHLVDQLRDAGFRNIEVLESNSPKLHVS
jgi:zinc protease